MDFNLLESGDSQMCLQLVGRIGVHPVYDLLPFSVVPGQAIILVDDQENPSAERTRLTPAKLFSMSGQK